MNRKLSLILLILIGSLNFANVNAQDGSKTEIRRDIFRSGEVIGNDGIEAYLITHQTEDIHPDSLLHDFRKAFGPISQRPSKNTYTWENVLQSNWYSEPINLEIKMLSMVQRDGETPTGTVWITVSAETENEDHLLKPGTESYKNIVSFFNSIILKRLDVNN